MKIIGTLLLAAVISFSANPLHAQTASFGGSVGIAQPIQSSSSDSIVAVTADAYGLSLVAPADLPRYGTYWVVLPYGGMVPMPCQPLDSTIPIYAITDTAFLVDSSGGAVAVSPRLTATMSSAQALTAAVSNQGNAIANLIEQVQGAQMMRDMAMMFGMDVPSFGDGGGDGGGYTNSYIGFTIDTNQLWLEITNVANGISYYNLHHATNQVYAIWTTTDLLQPFTVETELWPTNGDCQPFTLANYDRQFLFVRAQDWTGVDSDSDGIPDWWAWQYFGSVNVTDTNLDYSGNLHSFAYEYSNNIPPTVFSFTGLEVANNYVSTPTPAVQLDVAGSPYYIAVLVDDGNFSNAVWQTYSGSTVTVNLGSAQGWHDVWIGLRGHADDPTNAVWQWTRLKLVYTPTVLTLTNPTVATVDKPVIQLQGYSSTALSRISYDLSNAAGTVTNQPVLVEGQDYSTNTLEFTTNYFQAYDVPLTNGANVITLHATDNAGNVTTLVTNLTLTYSNKPAPVVQLLWPQDGMEIIGSNMVCRGWVSDDTATVTVQLVDANGATNNAGALVGRDGNFYTDNLTLATGTNYLSYTVTDAAGNTVTTNLTVMTSALGLTLNPVVAGQTLVTGTISDNSYTIYVNGVTATNDGAGNWSATITPIGIGGGAVVVNAILNGGNPSLQQMVAAPSGVFVSAHHRHWRTQRPNAYIGRDDLDWEDGQGGSQTGVGVVGEVWRAYQVSYSATSWPIDPTGVFSKYAGPHGADGAIDLATATLIYQAETGLDGDWCWNELYSAMPLGFNTHYQMNQPDNQSLTVDTERRLATGGPLGSRQMNLWCISATATDATTGQPIPPQQIEIGALGHLDTNGNLYVVLSDNDPPVVTPNVPGNPNYTFSEPTANKVVLQSLTVVSNAVQVGGTNNWAAVKTLTNDWVYLQATLSKDDTNAANQIQWSAGDAVPGNPFQRRVTKTVSAETSVTASLGSTNKTVKVWIIWGTVTVTHGGSKTLYDTNTDTGDAANFPFYTGGTELGAVNLLTNSTPYLGWKVEIKDQITPTGVHSIIPNTWAFVQTITYSLFDGTTNAPICATNAPDAAFNASNYQFEDSTPDSNDDIFALDAPGVFAPFVNNKCTVNFNVVVRWNGVIASDAAQWWASRKIERNGSSYNVITNSGGNGTITIEYSY